MVGDGLSDRCAARVADHVVARGALAEWCAAEGIAYHGFADFADVARIARAMPECAAVDINRVTR
jgi:2-hydroxy-3-keto-5-methylthiopentenyl-1-phosphate phosphatase